MIFQICFCVAAIASKKKKKKKKKIERERQRERERDGETEREKRSGESGDYKILQHVRNVLEPRFFVTFTFRRYLSNLCCCFCWGTLT